MRGAEPVEVRAVLAAQVQQVLEARGRDERRPRALALEQRVRRDGRPVREPLDARARRPPRAAASTDSSCRAAVGTFAVRSSPSVEQHRVGEGAADVQAEDGASSARDVSSCGTFDHVQMAKRVVGRALELSRCAGGEPVDLWRTLASRRGAIFLKPQVVDERERAPLETTRSGRSRAGGRCYGPASGRDGQRLLPGSRATGVGARGRCAQAGRDSRAPHAPASTRIILRAATRSARDGSGSSAGPAAGAAGRMLRSLTVARGRGQDDLRRELRLVGDRADDDRSSRTSASRLRTAAALSDAGRDGRGRQDFYRDVVLAG